MICEATAEATRWLNPSSRAAAMNVSRSGSSALPSRSRQKLESLRATR
jgi:hypothetical protein